MFLSGGYQKVNAEVIANSIQNLLEKVGWWSFWEKWFKWLRTRYRYNRIIKSMTKLYVFVLSVILLSPLAFFLTKYVPYYLH